MKKLTYLIILVLTTQICNATIINVPSEQATIQAGINAATEGDTVLVAADTYYENVVFTGQNIVLASDYVNSSDSNDIINTVIDGSSDTTVVILKSGEDSNTVIAGLTIQNGKVESTPGSGILCDGTNPIIRNCIIKNNGGVYSQKGGGIASINDAYPRIICSEISVNRSIMGGGIYAEGSIYIDSCLISNNMATRLHASYSSSGGGICFIGSVGIIKNSIIANNLASLDNFTTYHIMHGGGIYADCDSLIIEACQILSNKIQTPSAMEIYYGYGGGVYVSSNYGILTNNVFDDNGIIASFSAAFGHQSYIKGGGLYSEGNIIISDNCFVDNICSTYVGGFLATATVDACGGAIYSNGNDIITFNAIHDNRCYSSAENPQTPLILNSKGGGLHTMNAIVENNTIYTNYCKTNSLNDSSNTLSQGGGIWNENNSKINNNIIAGNFCIGNGLNKSGGYGGALDSLFCNDIWNNIPSNVEDTNITTFGNNISQDPLFCYPDTGHVYLYDASPCAPANNTCNELIGAFGVGCSLIPTTWYVSTTGNDETGIGTEAFPFRTIQYAIDISNSGDSVIVDAGTYTELINFSGKRYS